MQKHIHMYIYTHICVCIYIHKYSPGVSLLNVISTDLIVTASAGIS